ncbi:MAG: LCP family protein [Anaerolineae bacterium]|jgi:LCP family protein required for cell wall assembly|nr:LCP family protein [Anaerolineae bacterium]MDH7475431.1 LCP family protein [Anaerolineae bacterium]
MKSAKARRGRQQTSTWAKLILNFLFIVFVAGGIYAGYLFYVTVKDVVAHLQVPIFPNLQLPSVGASSGSQESDPVSNTSYNWESKDPIHIVLLGLDQRPEESGPSRTDTIIVIRVDPSTNSASMLSIPRDLWVSIPGYEENRINTANYIGDLKGYPGGGPALVKKTIEYNLGIRVHYYVRLNFEGFVRLIDRIGGIDIDVPQEIRDTQYPDPDNPGAYTTIYIPAGLQHMDGATALKYARTRHVDSDFGRLSRQQQVIMAVRDRVLRLDLIPQLLPHLSELMNEMGDAVQTDLQPTDIIRLAQLAQQIDDTNIKRGMVDSSMTVPWTTYNGAQVLLLDRDKVRPLVNELFPDKSPELDKTEVEVLDHLAAEQARIAVQNGTTTGSLATHTAAFLKERGFQVVQYGNADRFDYSQTMIIDYSGKPYTVDRLAQLFHIPESNIQRPSGVSSDVDILLIIGQDFQLPSD